MASAILRPFPARSTAGLDQSWTSWEAVLPDGSSFVFRLHVPAAPNPALVVFLDGSASNGHDNSRQLRYPRFLALFQGETALNAVVIAPQCPISGSWDTLDWSGPTPPRAGSGSAPMMDRLLEIVREVQERCRIPNGKCLIWGFSNGAFGALDALLHNPGRFGAFVSLGGGSDPDLLSRNLERQSLWLFHGGRDSNVPVEHSLRLARAVERAGKTCHLRIFPEADHPVMDSVCADADFKAFLRGFCALSE
jgi:predicted esterase